MNDVGWLTLYQWLWEINVQWSEDIGQREM